MRCTFCGRGLNTAGLCTNHGCGGEIGPGQGGAVCDANHAQVEAATVAAIVAWLRAQVTCDQTERDYMLWNAADAIERGEWRGR